MRQSTIEHWMAGEATKKEAVKVFKRWAAQLTPSLHWAKPPSGAAPAARAGAAVSADGRARAVTEVHVATETAHDDAVPSPAGVQGAHGATTATPEQQQQQQQLIAGGQPVGDDVSSGAEKRLTDESTNRALAELLVALPVLNCQRDPTMSPSVWAGPTGGLNAWGKRTPALAKYSDSMQSRRLVHRSLQWLVPLAFLLAWAVDFLIYFGGPDPVQED